MKTYSIYIFDLDGTLTDTMTVWLGIFREGLETFGVPVPEDKILAKYTHDWNELLEIGLPPEKLNDFIALAHRLANEQLPETPMHTGAYDMLRELKKQGKRIAIFSTMDRAIFEPALRSQKLDEFAEVTIAGNDVPRRKPQPDGLLKALVELGVPESEFSKVVYIRDKDTDILCAHSAGVDSILFFPPAHQAVYHREELLASKPTFVIEGWEELTSSIT